MFWSSAGVAQLAARRARRCSATEPRDGGDSEQGQEQPGRLESEPEQKELRRGERHSVGAPAEEGGEVPKPVALGRELDVTDSGGVEQPHGIRTLLGGRYGGAGSRRFSVRSCRRAGWRPVSGSTSRSSPTSASSCSRGSRISTARVGWRPGDAATRAASRSGRGNRRRSRRVKALDREAVERAPAPSGEATSPAGSSRRAPKVRAGAPRRPGAACARRGSSGPNSAGRPTRAGCRGAWPRGRQPVATPSATSALRRSAVPNAHRRGRVETRAM